MKKLMESWRKHITEEPSAMGASEIISHLDGMIDDLNSDVTSWDAFDGDVNNRSGHSPEELAFERGAAEAKRDVIEKLNAILEMIKNGDELAERDWQDESDKVKDHPRRKTRVLDTGANKETGGGKGHQKRDKKRGKSAPPGAGGV